MFHQKIIEERGAEDQCFWMSFCDTGKPQGQQFLGVIIMFAPGIAHAIDRTWKLGINPGGEVMSYVTEPHDIKPEHFDRLMSFQELVDAGYCDAECRVGFEKHNTPC